VNYGLSKSFLLVITISILLIFPGIVFGGAWTMEKGKMYNRLAFNYYLTQRAYDDDGNSHEMGLDGRFLDRNINWYEEYGLTDSLTLVTSVYYKWLNYGDRYISNDSQGPGDAEIGLRYRLFDDPVVLSIQGLFKYGKLYSRETPEIGNHQNDFEIRVLAGKSLWPFPGYCGFELGYRFRDDAPADELRYLAELGVNFTKRFYARIKLDGILGMGNGNVKPASGPSVPDNSRPDVTTLLGAGVDVPSASLDEEQQRSILSQLGTPSNPTITNEFNVLKLDIAFGYQMTEKIGVEVGYVPTIWGENISKGATTTFALTYLW